MSSYDIIAATNESTVVAEYTPTGKRADEYQSEAALEQELIDQLAAQGYEYIDARDDAALTANLRHQLELLNGYTFSDSEWARFFSGSIAGANEGIVEKTRRIQDDPVQVLKRDDGTTKNITLLEKRKIHNNRLQVLRQYEEAGGAHATRYDVTILVNGLPLVHIELKRRGIAIREAFNQIKRYSRDSFWAGSGLFEYVQLFVISNGTHTKYYSNTTREQHVREAGRSPRRKSKKTSNSFEFTSYWADANNAVIADLVDFTKTFFAKNTLLNILTHYCVFTAEQLLLVMRPYQIAATERIINRIVTSSNHKKAGTLEAGGYVWHTTGSGKTLTSFKTAQLATGLEGIDKVLFVVDRKDLDYQTMQEYERFEKGAANSNTSTAILKKNLEDPNARIIITTIQKLDNFIRKNKNHPVYNGHIVLIFDECHRSQFGEMHVRITKHFRNYHIFGFTGTPIFAINAGSGSKPFLKTTPQAFGCYLHGDPCNCPKETHPMAIHTYTIVDAIRDGNVLPFRIDYVDTVAAKETVQDAKVRAIDTEKAMNAPERIREVTSYILDHFDQKTKRGSFYSLKGKRMAGFNAIFAVSSIPTAMKYYTEFQRQLEERNSNLTIATIYSFSQNEDDPEDGMADEGFENDKLDKTSRDFLEAAIADYNRTFHVDFDTSADKFQNYYKDLSGRVKNREVDLVIVVNMFLTGFDATTLNTLWVDKNLKQHGLIQAFSRTNRILNSVKTFGNIICFRNLKQATDDAISLFGDQDAGGIVLMKTYSEYYNGYEEDGKVNPGYAATIATLQKLFPLDVPIQGETSQKEFIRLFGAILRLQNILSAFDEFSGNEILSERELQDHKSRYFDIYRELRGTQAAEKANINDDIVFELELIRQDEVNIDYILMMVAKYHESNCKDKSILTAIDKAVGSSLELRSKKQLIESFVQQVNVSTKVEEDWLRFVAQQKETDLTSIIQAENLNPEKTQKFISGAFRDGMLKTTGTDIENILPPLSRFGGGSGGNRAEKKQGVIQKLAAFFEKYIGLA